MVLRVLLKFCDGSVRVHDASAMVVEIHERSARASQKIHMGLAWRHLSFSETPAD